MQFKNRDFNAFLTMLVATKCTGNIISELKRLNLPAIALFRIYYTGFMKALELFHTELNDDAKDTVVKSLKGCIKLLTEGKEANVKEDVEELLAKLKINFGEKK
jgi:hypothetical protein